LGAVIAQFRCMRFERRIRAACGYAELGMTRESLAELNAIELAMQERPEVLHLRLHHSMQRKSWTRAFRISQQLCRVAPDCGTGFLHGGFCLHQLGKTAAARKLLLAGPPVLLEEPIYYYNMGCYEALLGNLHDAQIHLKISFEMDISFHELAKKDPDLKSLHALI
jgi:Flp pilus assembly protein TadD